MLMLNSLLGLSFHGGKADLALTVILSLAIFSYIP